MADERSGRRGAGAGRSGSTSSRSGGPRSGGPRSGSGRPGGRSGGGRSAGRGRDDRGGRGRDGERSGRGRDDRGGRGRDGERSGRGRDDRGGRGRDGERSGRGRDDRESRDDRGGRGRDGERSGRGRYERDSRVDRGGRGRGRDGGGRDNRRDGSRSREEVDEGAGPKEWGGLARRGAARLNDEASEQDLRDAGDHVHEGGPDEDEEARARREARQAKREAGEANRARLRSEAQAAIDRAGRPAPRKKKASKPSAPRERNLLSPRKLPDPKYALANLLGNSAGGRAWRDLNAAADHLDAGRAGAAQPIAQALYRKAPEVLEVAEIWGLTLYSLGRWREAIEILEDVREQSGLTDNNPVLADAHRAVGNYADVAWLWDELREASPASEIMTEGRIVAAGALADSGDLGGAVRLLSKGWKRPKRPFEHHLRRAYALADLYDRAGERPRAKELFAWIAHHEPKYVDAAHRAN